MVYLIANVARGAFANGRDLVHVAREEGLAARCPSETTEHVRIPVSVLLIEDTDGVHKSAGLLVHLQTSARLCRLALSPPPLITINTFLSRLQAFNRSRVSTTES